MPSSRCARVNLLGKQGKEIRVSAEENKAIVRRWFEDLFFRVGDAGFEPATSAV
jgi:hypothetical protein